MERFNINGFNICMLPDNRLKTAAFIVYIRTPLNLNSASENALIPAVLTRGCKKYPETKDLNIALEELFGATISFHVEKQGAYQVISIKFKTVADCYADNCKPFSNLISLAFEVLFSPLIENGGFRKSYTDREREVQIQFLDGLKNDKRKWASIRLIKEMCKNEEYSISAAGEKDNVQSITEKSLYDAYLKLLESAKISFYVTDNFEKDNVLPLLQDLLSDKKAQAGEVKEPYIKKSAEIKMIEDVEPVTQGKLAIGLRTTITRKDNRYYAMMLFNRLYGGSPYSKLFLNVREKLSLAYYASSTYNSHKGLVIVSSGIEFKNYEPAKNEILAQLKEMQNGNFTLEEIESAKLDIKDTFTGIADYGEMLADFDFALDNAGVSDSPQDVIDKVTAVTKEEIVDAANTVFVDTIYFLKGENE